MTRKRYRPPEPSPLLVELFEKPRQEPWLTYSVFPFSYSVARIGSDEVYSVVCEIHGTQIEMVRRAVAEASASLNPSAVDPLTFGRLVEVMTQLSAGHLGGPPGTKTKELAELAAYEAIGLSRILALAKDPNVTEFFTDSDSSPVYLDHIRAGRCESAITLVKRERDALETHLDTFRGYTPDFSTPSLKNDLEISGARLRVSLDLEPVCVNRFALDVRRLGISSLPMTRLIEIGVITVEAAAELVAWLESGGNITIVGETGTGKTTLLNALDELVEPKLRRLYIEDAVETKDMLASGYHQMKIKVDPFDRAGGQGRTKESEIVKALHRSPDLVVLSEIQSEEHSRAFFHSLSAGAKGIQTFHAPSMEHALSRWLISHGIPKESLLDLGVLVLMARPNRLKPDRFVRRICLVESDEGKPALKELYSRGHDKGLVRTGPKGWPVPSAGSDPVTFEKRALQICNRLGTGGWTR